MISDKSRVVLNSLIAKNIIDKTSTFEINQDLINTTFEEWNNIYHPGYSKNLKSTAIRYGKKIAGINLMKLNEERINSFEVSSIKKDKTHQRCGIVYVITNPAYPGYFKVGMTSDLDTRLKSYQTYDPLQRFKVEHYSFVLDRRKAEKQILEKFKLDIVKGEWVNNEDVKSEIINLY